MTRATEDEAASLIKLLEEHKEALEMTWAAVAEDVGVSASSLANWRSEETRPTGKNLEALRKWTQKIARRIAGKAEKPKPKTDQGAVVVYVVQVAATGGRSGTVPSADGLRDILEKAGLTVAVVLADGEVSNPVSSVDVAIRHAVREELRAALANGVSLSLG